MHFPEGLEDSPLLNKLIFGKLEKNLKLDLSHEIRPLYFATFFGDTFYQNEVEK